MKLNNQSKQAPQRSKQFAVRKLSLCVAGVLSMLASSQLAHAVISQTPLFLAQQPRPNIMFTFDDSGSMNWNCVPDALCPYDEQRRQPTSFDFTDNSANVNIARWRSVDFNGLAYDPNVLYLPWQKADRSYYPNSIPNKALGHPRNAQVDGEMNLIDTGNKAKYLAFYYKYKTANAGRNPTIDHFDRIEIRPGTNFGTKGTDRTDCKGASCTYDEEIQNFANWFTFYRKRYYTAIAGASQAFNPLEGNQRVGYGQINQLDNVVDGVPTQTVVLPVRDFVGKARTDFYDRLFLAQGNGTLGTPLRKALNDVGKYFSRSDNLGPWAEKPGVERGTEYSCRKTFHILMTDGYWNHQAVDASPAGKSNPTNADNVDGEEYVHPQTSVRYKYIASTASNYFKSTAENTLADIAMYYWNRDLRPDLANNVPTTSSDEAFWQHITQYTVGLGVVGTLKYPDDTNALKAGTKSWPDPGRGENPAAVDDLWHAAVNGHGLYFSAKNPKAFRDGMQQALEDIAKQQAAASTVALNFTSSGVSGAKAFIPSFESGSWVGSLQAKNVVDGSVGGEAVWKAEEKLPAWNARNILTLRKDNNTIVPFLWDKISDAQKALLENNDVLEYLRGNGAKERAAGGQFRNRPSKLGDIVNSSPLYVHKASFAYEYLRAPEAKTYAKFVTDKAKRTPMLYVGANDGMLHAFNASTGVEAFAYVPNVVYPNLKLLTATNYAHRYFVDGQLVEGDIYHATNGWRSVVLGSTGAGGKSMFALDVTSPTDNSGANTLGASNVLWEKDSTDFPDLGHQLGKPAIVRLRDGTWAAVFGNGYESDNKKAVLYIVNAQTGALIKKLDTGSGSAAAPNGLSTPALLYNNDRELVAAYAGDLQGNLWKFDLSDASSASWNVAFAGQPLFTAKDKTTDRKLQPIVLRPVIGFHPNGGYMINFATGKYFETGDGSTTQVQSAYGIWDKVGINGVTPTVVSGNRETALQEQKLSADSATANVGGGMLTTTTVDWKTKRGWFIDLTLGNGERGVGEPFITDDTTLWITTLDPVSDPCVSGGVSRLMGFNYLSGGANDRAVMDTNGDGVVNASDSKISVIRTGGSIAANSTYVKPAPCTGPSCTPPPPDKAPACQGSSLKVLINRLDGTTQEMSLNRVCVPPLRSWHQINIGY